jgi:hypothetical protein
MTAKGRKPSSNMLALINAVTVGPPPGVPEDVARACAVAGLPVGPGGMLGRRAREYALTPSEHKAEAIAGHVLKGGDIEMYFGVAPYWFFGLIAEADRDAERLRGLLPGAFMLDCRHGSHFIFCGACLGPPEELRSEGSILLEPRFFAEGAPFRGLKDLGAMDPRLYPAFGEIMKASVVIDDKPPRQ